MEPTQQPIADAQVKAKDKALEIIRSELNLEQWSVWQPTSSRTAPKAKTFTREITLPDGSKARARVEVLPTIKGSLTTEDQKMLYALVKQWEERGRLETLTPFSLQRLARLLKKKWGTQTIEGLIGSLTRLRGTLFTWTNAYFDSATEETVEVLDTFNILSDLRIARRRQGEVTTSEAGYYRFHSLVLGNLRNNHTKPVIYEVAISFRSEIAQLLYGRLDRFLFDKTQYERRTKELFDDLGLEGKAYNYASKRKQMLEPALKELTGKPLTSGRITSAALEPTADGKDFKVVFRKGARHPHLQAVPTLPPQSRGEPPSTTAATNDPITDQAVQLAQYFYKRFFDTDKALTDKNSKPIGQAVSLIAQHGFEQAKYIVDFAHRVAPETNFQIQTFGGILNYEARAIAEYEDDQRRQQQRVARKAEEVERHRLEEEHEEYRRQAIEAYLAEHREELPAQIEAKKKALLKERRNLYSQWKDEVFTDFALRAVRRDLAHKLELLAFGDYYEQHRSRELTSPPADQTNS